MAKSIKDASLARLNKSIPIKKRKIWKAIPHWIVWETWKLRRCIDF